MIRRTIRVACVLTSLLMAQIARADAAPTGRAKLGRDLVIAGEVILATGYTFSAGTSFAIGLGCGAEPGDALCQRTRFLWGALPVAGPWVQVGYDHEFGSSVALFAVPAIVQAVGLGLLIAGVVVRHRASYTSPARR